MPPKGLRAFALRTQPVDSDEGPVSGSVVLSVSTYLLLSVHVCLGVCVPEPVFVLHMFDGSRATHISGQPRFSGKGFGAECEIRCQTLGSPLGYGVRLTLSSRG